MKQTARRGGALLIAALALGCSPTEEWPAEFPKSVYTYAQLKQGDQKPFNPAPKLRTKTAESLLPKSGTPADPKIKGATDDRNFAIHKGSRLYRMHCMYCHGPAGAGN